MLTLGEALRVFTRLYGGDLQTAQERVRQIELSIEGKDGSGEPPRCSDLLLSSSTGQQKTSDKLSRNSRRTVCTCFLRPIVWSGIGVAAFQQFIGINVILYYGSVLWQAVGFSENSALQINILSGVCSTLAQGVTVKVIDVVGRRRLLLYGSSGCCILLSLAAFAFSFSQDDASGEPTLSRGYSILALISANCYVGLFQITWGPVTWVLLGEMFPNNLRGAALAVSGFSQWMSNFLITLTFPLLLDTMVKWLFWILRVYTLRKIKLVLGMVYVPPAFIFSNHV